MSICSDVYIEKEKAIEMVKTILMSDQEYLIDCALKGMDNFDLSHYLNKDSDIYFYNIIPDLKELYEEMARLMKYSISYETWLNTPTFDLGGSTPQEVIDKAPNGRNKVRQLIEATIDEFDNPVNI